LLLVKHLIRHKKEFDVYTNVKYVPRSVYPQIKSFTDINELVNIFPHYNIIVLSGDIVSSPSWEQYNSTAKIYIVTDSFDESFYERGAFGIIVRNIIIGEVRFDTLYCRDGNNYVSMSEQRYLLYDNILRSSGLFMTFDIVEKEL